MNDPQFIGRSYSVHDESIDGPAPEPPPTISKDELAAQMQQIQELLSAAFQRHIGEPISPEVRDRFGQEVKAAMHELGAVKVEPLERNPLTDYVKLRVTWPAPVSLEIVCNECSPVTNLTLDWKDIDYRAVLDFRRAHIADDPYVMDFKVYPVSHWEYWKDGEHHETVAFVCHEGRGYGHTEDVTKAIVFMRGSLKWDGCMDMVLDDQANVMTHFCGRKDAAKLGQIIDRLYDVMAVLRPGREEELE